MVMDPIDQAILKRLKENAKLTFREIGEEIHMTGQAVGVRINRMLDEGIIEKFTVAVNPEKVGLHVIAIVKIIMTTHDHSKIRNLIAQTDEIVEAHRVSGEGCYQLKIEVADNRRLNEILDKINGFANYQLSLSIDKVK